MTIEAQLSDGRTLQFPDGTPPEVVQSTVKKMIGAGAVTESAPEPESYGKRLLRAGTKGLVSGGPLSSLLGMGGETLNMANEAVSKGAYDAGGAVTDFFSRQGASVPLAAGLGTAANVGINAIPTAIQAAVPMTLGGKAATAIAQPAIKDLGNWFMQSAVKPNITARKSGDWVNARTTMFDKGINATQGAMDDTLANVKNLEASIQSVLENSPGMVNKEKIAQAAQVAVKDVELNLNVVNNLADIDTAVKKFINHPALAQYGNEIPVAVANRMKQAFRKELSGKAYLPGQALSAEDRAQKSLTAGLRSEVGAAEPAVVPNLKEQSELLNVLKVVGPQMGREGNKNILGLGVLSPTMERTMIWMLDRYPWFKSMVARGLYSGSEAIPQAGTTAGIGLAELQTK